MARRFELDRTPDDLRLLVWRSIDAPAEEVWDVFVDTALWPEWGPSVTAVESTDRRVVEGTTGRVRTVGGRWLPFTVTAQTGSRWTWRIGPVPATGHRVEPTKTGSRAAFEIPLYAAPYAVVCWWALRSIGRLATDSSVAMA
jgi:hypothetical protein